MHANYGTWQALPFWIAVVLLVLYFRHPKRVPPVVPWSIVAPIDAVVEGLFCTQDPFLGKMVTVVRLRRRHFGVMALYSPTQGQMVQSWYGEQFARSNADGSADLGHIYTARLENQEHDNVLISFYRAKTLRYLQVQAQPGERIGQGRQIGISSIQFVDVSLPNNIKLEVKIGDILFAGQSPIGTLIHSNPLF